MTRDRTPVREVDNRPSSLFGWLDPPRTAIDAWLAGCPPQNSRRASIVMAAHVASTMAHTENRVPLNYRGAVTFGEFTIDENFLVGPAIDEVAELHNRTDGAFIEVTRGAADVLQRGSGPPLPPDLSIQRLALEHDVPIKAPSGGAATVERCWIANPFATCGNADEMLGVMDGMKRAFGPDPSTNQPTKYRATLDLLAAARRAWETRPVGVAFR